MPSNFIYTSLTRISDLDKKKFERLTFDMTGTAFFQVIEDEDLR